MKISALAVIFALIFAAGCTGSSDVETCTDDTTKLTKTQEMALANNTFNYIDQVYLAPQNITGEIGSIESFGYVYLLKFTFGGAGMPPQETEAYVTSDGKLLMVQGIVDTKVIPDMQPTQTPAPTEAPAQTRATVDIDDDYCLGSEDAPVTIVEFSDYQCPYCQRFWSQTLPQIKSEYIDKGTVKLIFRDFPLGFHQNAQKAAEAAECAGDEGKFWDMHDTLFAGLAEWQGSTDASSVFKGYAAELGLDEDAFAQCLDSGKYTEETQKDLADGSAAGVSGTPAFFVNGVFITGAQPYETFKAVIDEELAADGVNSTITGTCTGK